jgi:UPF0042 nucleotide-binding protein
MIKVMSFGYKANSPPTGATLVDCRGLNNPHSFVKLRPLTGCHKDVQDYVGKDPGLPLVLRRGFAAVKSSDAIAFGCFGGRHRSVAVAEMFAAALRASGNEVEVTHRELAA